MRCGAGLLWLALVAAEAELCCCVAVQDSAAASHIDLREATQWCRDDRVTDHY